MLCTIEKHSPAEEELLMMAVWRRWQVAEGMLGMRESARVVEPELDMERRRPRVPATFTRLNELMKWLGPSRGPIGPPMRSVDRELEELFPSRLLID
jgi:hypothetical protein